VKLVIHVDGGARGNPGPAAAGVVVLNEEGTVIHSASRTLGRTTNNVAEYQALLLGIECAKQLAATDVEFIGDSELVVKQINGEYRVKNEALRPLYQEALRKLSEFDRWSIRSVAREKNAGADALVNQALDA
jgi:ribonuclease HI